MYSNDPLSGWGYYVAIKPSDYLILKECAALYDCDFADEPHITMQYNGMNKMVYVGNDKIQGTLAVVDIRSNDPCKWHVLNM